MNQFQFLSAENPEDRMAQITPEESQEYNNYLDEIRARQDAEEGLTTPMSN